MTTTTRAGGGAGAVAAVLVAALAAGSAAAFAATAALRQPDHTQDDGPDGPRVAELMLAARAADRFGLLYPTPAAGWRQPALRHPVLSRPPGTDLATRAAFAFFGTTRATARGVAVAATALAVLAMARLAWIGWGAWAAAGGAALMALTPYTARWGAFPHGGMPALAAVLMALGSVLQFRRTRSRLPAAMATIWMLTAGLFDWSAYLVVVPLAALAFGGGAVGQRIGRSRPHALGLPDGLAGPLANIVMRREGRTAVTLTAALAIAAGVELLFFFGWFFEMDVLGAFFATLGGAGGEPLLATRAPPGALSPALVGVAGPFVVAAWAAVALARALRGQAEARSLPVAALLGAGLLFPWLWKGMAATSFHLPALAVGGVVLASVDLAAAAGALLVERRLTLPYPTRAAGAVSLAGLAALALAAVPGWRRAHAEPPGPDARAEARALARAAGDVTGVDDRLLLAPDFRADLRFLLDVDRDVERVGGLGELEARAARDPHAVALLRDPPPPADLAAFGALLRAHPATRIGGSWLVDVRRHEPGVRTYAVNGRALRPQPVDDLRLDLAHGVAPSRDRVPELGDGEDEGGHGGGGSGGRNGSGDLGALTRTELIAYHNMLAPGPGRERVRARILDGVSGAPRWFDPAPLGLPAGVRWDAGERRLDVLWACTGTPPPLPAGVAVAGARVVLKPVDRDWAPTALDRPVGATCPPGAPAGELHEQSFSLKLPFRGRFRVAIQLMREGKPRRALNPAPVELGAIDAR